MAKPLYQVAPGHKFFDNWQMQEEGAKVSYDHDPGENLIPLNSEAKAAWKRVHGSEYRPPKPVLEPGADEAED